MDEKSRLLCGRRVKPDIILLEDDHDLRSGVFTAQVFHNSKEALVRQQDLGNWDVFIIRANAYICHGFRVNYVFCVVHRLCHNDLFIVFFVKRDREVLHGIQEVYKLDSWRPILVHLLASLLGVLLSMSLITVIISRTMKGTGKCC